MPLYQVLTLKRVLRYMHSYLTLLMANIKKWKETATDSNYLKCHTLLAALHFPLETTSCSWKQNTKERYWGQQFRQMESDISVRPTEITRPVEVAFKAGPEYSGRTKPKWSVPFHVPTEIFGQG